MSAPSEDIKNAEKYAGEAGGKWAHDGALLLLVGHGR